MGLLILLLIPLCFLYSLYTFIMQGKTLDAFYILFVGYVIYTVLRDWGESIDREKRREDLDKRREAKGRADGT